MNITNDLHLRVARLEARTNRQYTGLLEVQRDALTQAISAEDAETAAELARSIRDKLLQDSDAEVLLDRMGLQVPESTAFEAWLPFLQTLGGALGGAWAQYRQALRDLPQQVGFPLAIQWPIAPDGTQEGIKEEQEVM